MGPSEKEAILRELSDNPDVEFPPKKFITNSTRD